jgi:hypothetical protein
MIEDTPRDNLVFMNIVDEELLGSRSERYDIDERELLSKAMRKGNTGIIEWLISNHPGILDVDTGVWDEDVDNVILNKDRIVMHLLVEKGKFDIFSYIERKLLSAKRTTHGQQQPENFQKRRRVESSEAHISTPLTRGIGPPYEYIIHTSLVADNEESDEEESDEEESYDSDLFIRAKKSILQQIKDSKTDLVEYLSDEKLKRVVENMWVGDVTGYGEVVCTMRTRRQLTEKELRLALDDLSGQLSDGWGENGWQTYRYSFHCDWKDVRVVTVRTR